MGKQYMDYSSISTKDTYTIPKNLTLIDYNKKGLVYRLTHDGEGNSLSFMNKAFISFTYGNRKILDFGFIATTINNRLDRLNPPDSEDYTTEYKMLNGQYYWGSHYQARELVITLATDGITQKQLDDFKYWFQPGEIRELILSLHPNRAIQARIQGKPEISVLPFKRTETIFINNIQKDILVIEYKGEAQINFVMDLPFWYAKNNVLGNLIEDDYGNYVLADTWLDNNGNVINILDTDAWKVAIEDKIPTSDMLNYLVIYSDTIQLLPYNIYKYTLDELKKILAKNDKGLLTVGAPLANDDYDIQYPLSGAVIGMLYKKIYKEGLIITHISNKQVKLGFILTSDGMIDTRKYIEGLGKKRDLITTDYIAIKAGSTIQYISNKLDGNVTIQKYVISDDNEYSYKLDLQIILLYRNTNFIAEKDMIIRINITIPLLSWNDSIDGTFLLSKFIKISLIPMDTEFNGYKLSKDNNLYYFYSGNAISYPKIKFSIPIHFNDEGYIDSFSSENLLQLNLKSYNTIKLESEFVHELKITNPSIFDSYNMVIKKLKEEKEQDLPSFVQLLRNTITHPAVRNWIINCINIYYNNFDMEAMIIDSSVKNQLLQYMPYLFVSFKDANIQIKEELPETKKLSFQTLYKTEIKRIDELSERMPITDNNEILVREGSSFKIQIDTYLDSKNVINSNLSNKLYYQWQYSDKNDPTKWYLIFNDYDEDSLTGTWRGATLQILEGYNISEDDFGINLRCVVSNNSMYILDKVVSIQEYISDISMTPENNNVDINQNSETTITWNITGSYLRGNNTATAIYKPKIFYQPYGVGLWVLYNKNNNNYAGQIENGEFSIIRDDKITFKFTARENAQRKLRNTKFKLVIYPLDALTNEVNLNNNIAFPPITINIIRLEVSNPIITFTATYGNNPPEILTNNNVRGLKGYRAGTKLKLNISGVLNINTDNENTYLLLGKIQKGELVWGKIVDKWYKNVEKNITLTNINFEWTLNLNWNNSLNKIRITIKNYGELEHLLENADFRIQKIEDDSINDQLDAYNPKKVAYDNGYNSNLYEQKDKLSLTVNWQEGVIPALASHYSITYSWYYMKNLINDTIFDFSQATLLMSNTYDNELVNTHTFEINKNNVTINDTKGYYKCQVILELEGANASYVKDISPSNYIEINVIKQISITNPTCNILGWAYYSDILLMDDENGNPVSFTSPKTLSLSYTINNYNSNDIISVKWYCIKDNTKTVEELTSGITMLDNVTTYSTNCSSAKSLNDLQKFKFYCLVIDIYNIEPYSSFEDNYIQLYFPDKRNRIIDISLNEVIQNVNNNDTSWNWPVFDCKGTKTSSEWSVLQLIISYSMLWKDNKKLILNGTPKTNTISSESIVGYANRDAAGLDGYKLNAPNAMTLLTKLSLKYEGYNASYHTVLLFPSNKYEKIILEADVNVPNNLDFKYYYRIIQGDSVLFPETELVSNIKTINVNLDLIEQNSNNIEFQIKIYYNIYEGHKWPNNIGTLKNAPSSVTMTSGNQNFDATKFPVLDNTLPIITITTLQGKLYYSNMLYMSSRTFRALQNIIAYLSPIISQTCSISLNCATGEYYMQITYNTINWSNGILPKDLEDGNIYNPKLICYLSSLRNGLSHIVTESIGNAILYNDLVFMLQNHFDPVTNKIKIWDNNDKTLCHKLSYDGDIPLLYFNMLYKNLYL